MAKSNKKFYAVAAGRKPGIYSTWFGEEGAEVQIKGFEGARFKGFATRAEAEKWMENPGVYKPRGATKHAVKAPVSLDGYIHVYSDGGALGNPGPGGYGVVIENGSKSAELSGGYRKTTNNRMELMGCIMALRYFGDRTKVAITTDSKYVVNGIMLGWAKKWQKNGWMRTKSDAAENYDLWQELLELTAEHDVVFQWVKGHAGHAQNERCDELAKAAAAGRDQDIDQNYEQGKTTIVQKLF